MRSSYTLWGALALLLCCWATAQASVSFKDDFRDDDVSDWAVTNKKHHSISASGGVLQLPQGAGTDGVTRYCEIYPIVTGTRRLFMRGKDNVISASADIKGNDESDQHSAGEMGLNIYLSTDDGAAVRYDFRIHSGNEEEVRLRKKASGPIEVLATKTQVEIGHPDTSINADFVHYELRLTIGEQSNLIELLINGKVVMSANEAFPITMDRAGISLFSGNNNDILADNVQLITSATPTAKPTPRP